MSLTHEKLTELYPEHKDAILGITTEELNSINQYLNGADNTATTIGTGSTIYLTPPHVMRTTNAPNTGNGTPLHQTAWGYRPDPVPKFHRGTPYEVSLNGDTIILTVEKKRYLYHSVTNLLPDGAGGVIVSD